MLNFTPLGGRIKIIRWLSNLAHIDFTSYKTILASVAKKIGLCLNKGYSKVDEWMEGRKVGREKATEERRKEGHKNGQ